MKLYNRRDFMGLPVGTVYSKGKQWYFGNLQVFGGKFGDNDFTCIEVAGIEAESSEDWVDKLEDMLKNGTSVPCDKDGYGRDGMYDNTDLFLVFEKEDLEHLSKIVNEAIEVTK